MNPPLKTNPNDSAFASYPKEAGLSKREKLIFDLYVRFASFTNDRENKYTAQHAVRTADILFAELDKSAKAKVGRK